MAYSLTSLVDKVRQTLTGAVAQAPTTLSNIGNRVVGGYNEVAKALPLVPTTQTMNSVVNSPVAQSALRAGSGLMGVLNEGPKVLAQGLKQLAYTPFGISDLQLKSSQASTLASEAAKNTNLGAKINKPALSAMGQKQFGQAQDLYTQAGNIGQQAIKDVGFGSIKSAAPVFGAGYFLSNPYIPALSGAIGGVSNAVQKKDIATGVGEGLGTGLKQSAFLQVTNPLSNLLIGGIQTQLTEPAARFLASRITQGSANVIENRVLSAAFNQPINTIDDLTAFAMGALLPAGDQRQQWKDLKQQWKTLPRDVRKLISDASERFSAGMKPAKKTWVMGPDRQQPYGEMPTVLYDRINDMRSRHPTMIGALDNLVSNNSKKRFLITPQDQAPITKGLPDFESTPKVEVPKTILDMTNEQLAKAQVPVQKLQQQGRQIQMMEPLARGARQMAKAEAEVKAGVIGDELNTQDRTKLGQLKLVFQRADQNEGAWDVKSLSKNNKTLITWAIERWREIYPYKANMTDDELINDIYSFVKDNQLSKKPKLDTPGIVKTMQQAREDQKTLARLSEYGEDQFPVRKGQPMTIADSEAQQKMIEQRLTKSGARDATLDELEAILNTPDNQLKGGYAIEEGPGIAANAKGTGDDPQTFRGIINKFLGGKENIKLSQYEQVKPIADVKFTDEGAKQAIKAIETGDTDGLAPQIKEYVSTLRKSFDKIRSEAVADGLPIGYIDNYLTHYWEQPPDQVQAVINGLRKSGAFQKERVFLTYEEGINAGLTPRFKNPTQILGHYVRQVENIRNNLKLVKQLESNGYIISGDERKLVQGVREIAIPGFSGKFAKPEVARVIEGLFEPKEANKIIGTLAKISGKIQDVTLSGGIPGTPFNAFSVAGNLQKQFLSGRFSGPLKSFARAFSPGETTKYFQENIPVIREIQGAGYSLPTTLNYSKLIGDEAGGISKVWDATVSDPTFKRFIPMMQIDLYKEVKDKALKAGLSNDQALEKALAVLKNFEGMSDMYSRATQDPNARAVTQALFFAPKFRQAILGIWASSIKALKNPSALENQYNARFLAGSVLTYAAMNAANAYFNNGKMMWENGKNKEDKLIIPDGQGGEIGVPFLSSLGTIPRGIARQGMKILKGDISGAATDAGQTYLSSGIKPIADVMANQDYFGKKIVQPDSKSKWGDILSYLGRSYLSHPYIKELFDPRNTSDPGYQRLSRSMELPFRFYDKKSVDSSKYFEARDKALESLSEIEKKAYDAVPKYDEKNPDSQIFKYQTFLTYPNVFEAKRMTEFNLAKQTGKAIDPLYLVNYDTAKAYMRYETLPPGSQDRKDLLKIKPELAALFDVRSKYFKENPMEGQAKSSRPLPSEYIQQQMDAKNWSDPQVRAYLDANTQYQNEQRAKLGLAPLAGFTQFAKKPKRVSVKLAKVNAPKIKLPKIKLPRIKMTKPLRLGKIRVRLK